MTLDDLHFFESALIDSVNTEKNLKKRLQDIGFIKGSEITFLYSTHKGTPKAYLVKGAVIALRKSDAEKIFVTRINNGGECYGG